jgi:hypothetical protein
MHNIGKFDKVYVPEGVEYATWHKLETVAGKVIGLDGNNIPAAFPNIVEDTFKLATIPAEKLLADAMDEDEETESNPLQGWKMILADTGKGFIPLHVPKAGYVIHQNRTLFDSFVASAKAVCGEGVKLATVGTLGNLSQFFISAELPGLAEFTIKGKGKNKFEHRSYYNLVSSHNGLTASATMLSIVRVVCQNTVNASLSDAESNGKANKFKHTKESLGKITPEAFELALREWVKARESYIAALQSFEAVKMTVDGFKAFASGVFTNEKSDELSTTSFNRVNDMVELFQRGRGNYGVTLADGINAFTEYFTSGNGVGSDKVNPGKRVASANFGRGNDWKRLAIAIAANEQDFAATTKRGEILYTDKEKTVAVGN